MREEDPLNFLFCWSSVPGNDNPKFLSFIKKWLFEQLWEDTTYEDYTTEIAVEHLKKCNISIDLKKFSDKGNDYADSILAYVKLMIIDWDENIKIKKINDITISFSYLDNSGEITLDENRKNAIIKINNQYSDKLHVKDENSKLNIYKYTDKQISSWADIIIRFFEIKPGHKVIVYGKSFHINALAEVIGEYEFNKNFNFPYIKRVKWLQIFEKPLDIKPILSNLEKQAFRPTVVDISKKIGIQFSTMLNK